MVNENINQGDAESSEMDNPAEIIGKLQHLEDAMRNLREMVTDLTPHVEAAKNSSQNMNEKDLVDLSRKQKNILNEYKEKLQRFTKK